MATSPPHAPPNPAMAHDGIDAYLVGGAVRDILLGLPVLDRDWVVVGQTPESMARRGFQPVGKDFPVFLHPHTRDEYALARTERKTAPGYKGFAVRADPDVSLEQDLIRRDLTINAMAMAADGRLIDPYGGQQDLEARLLRHVSCAFAEDPVRVLRVARFAARLRHLGFTVAEPTLALMRAMVSAGEVDALVAERVWAELVKALSEPSPSVFFQTLRECGALARIFPELDNLFGVPQPAQHHPEIDTGVHSLLCLEQAALLTASVEVRFATLVHDLGKALSPKDNWPHHYGHEQAGVPVLTALCARLKAPNAFKTLAVNVMRYHTHCHRAFELRPATLTDTLAALGAFKPNNQLPWFLLACEADARGRAGFEHTPYPQAQLFRQAAALGTAVDTSALLAAGLQGPALGEAIRQARIKAIAQLTRPQTATVA